MRIPASYHRIAITRLRSRTLLIALLVTLNILLWETIVFGTRFSLATIFTTQREGITYTRPLLIVVGVFVFLAVKVVLDFLFIWASLVSNLVTRIACFVLFVVAELYEYSTYTALARFSTPDDMIMAGLYWKDETLMRDSILAFITPWAIPTIVLFGIALMATRAQRRTYSLLVPVILVLMVVFHSFVYGTSLRYMYPITAFSEFASTATYVPWKLQQSYHGARDQITFRADAPPRGNILFIVDESIRSDHLSLNGYERPTTPYLEELARRSVLYNWGEAVSTGTSSLPSNNFLLTGITELPDTQQRLPRMPSIFQYAKAMGYTTHYVDDTVDEFWNGTSDDLRYIDHWDNAALFKSGIRNRADVRMARSLRLLLTSSDGNFVWVNKRGVHFNYNNAFPIDQAHWKPILQHAAYDPTQLTEMVNSYDNGILYNTEGFFRTLLSDQRLLENTIIVYTSDHGQTLSEFGETSPHGGDSRNEARVPLFMLSGRRLAVDTTYRASHTNIFPTLLDLMGFPAAERHERYALSLLEATAADSQPRRYFPGGLENDDGWREFDR